MKRLIGHITEAERDEIRQLFERRNGLNELAKILTIDNAALYDKMVADLGETSRKFQDWWDNNSTKYQWQSAVDGHWEIDFATCKIYLIIPD